PPPARRPRGAVHRRRHQRPQGRGRHRRRVPRPRHPGPARSLDDRRRAPRPRPDDAAGAGGVVVTHAATRVLFFRPSLGGGGAAPVPSPVWAALERAGFAAPIALVRAGGPLSPGAPADVPVIDLGASRLALAVPALARALARSRPDVLFSTASAANLIAI